MLNTIELKIGDLVFDCRVDGNQESELVILLHGFPETSHMWINLMKDFSDMGFYCVAPNLRGYSKGACPKGVNHYSLDKLAKDVIEIARYFKKSKFHLVGHDWGAAIGWKVVHDHQSEILSWTALSVPHLQGFGTAIVKDDQQRKMSQYIRSFQWPVLPEKKIKKNDFELFRKLWKNSDSDEISDYLTVFRNRNQLTAAINYYRSNYKLLRKAVKGRILGDIHVPTLFIWGNKDLAIGSVSVDNSHQYIKNNYQYIELDTGHWLIQTKYDELRDSILKHIKDNTKHFAKDSKE